MYEEPYSGVMREATKLHSWVIAFHLADLSCPERVKWLERHFLFAAGKRDDEATLQLWQLLCTALNDKELLPLAKEERGGLALPNNDVVRDAWRRATFARADKARTLYSQLPAGQKVKTQVLVTESDYETAVVDRPTLIKTRQAMFYEVAKGWRNASTDGEARPFLEFLTHVPHHYQEESRAFLDAVRQATDALCPFDRLMQGLIFFAEPEMRYNASGVDHILAVALARSRPQELARLLTLAEPVCKSTSEGYDLALRLTDQAGVFDRDVQELLKTMKGTEKGTDPASRVGGEISVAYPALNRAVITVAMDIHYWEDTGLSHRNFDRVQMHVEAWLKGRPDVSVRLTLTANVDKRHSGEGWVTAVAVREQEFRGTPA